MRRLITIKFKNDQALNNYLIKEGELGNFTLTITSAGEKFIKTKFYDRVPLLHDPTMNEPIMPIFEEQKSCPLCGRKYES
jgi:hypothetical protein